MRTLSFIGLTMLLASDAAATEAPASPASTVAEASTEILDNQAIPELDAAIKNARFVLLGEPWHGDGGAIALRSDIVRYLTVRHGFDVIVFEADFFAMHRGWQAVADGGSVKTFAEENIYSFWSQSKSAGSLWSFVADQHRNKRILDVAGMDTKLVGKLSRDLLPQELIEQLGKLPDSDPRQAAEVGSTLRRLLHPDGRPPVTEQEFANLVKHVDLLASNLNAEDRDSLFWRQVAKSIKRNILGEYRDPGMADNLIWLAETLYPDRKIFVWLHNNHGLMDKWSFYGSNDPTIQRLAGSEPRRSIGERTYVGETLRRYYGPEAVYSIATLSYTGTYSRDIMPALVGQRADFSDIELLPATSPQALETALAALGRRRAFVNLRKFQNLHPVANRAIDYSQLPELTFELQKGYDGVLFAHTTHGLNSN